MKLPDIMKKNKEDVLKEIRGKAPFYTPEWSFENKGDFGAALSEIFAHYSETFVKRLNQAPTRHFLAFLETINASLLPAEPARVPLTFVLSEGAGESVLVPAGTEASASDSEGKPIPFQTTDTFAATPSKPVYIFAVIPNRDTLSEHSQAIGGVSSAYLFGEKNLQEHTLYIGDRGLLNLRTKARIEIHITPPDEGLLKMLQDGTAVRWAYGTETLTSEDGREIKAVDWLPLGAAVKKAPGAEPMLVLTKSTNQPIDEIDVGGLKSRWIKGSLVGASTIETFKSIRISSLKVSVAPEEGMTVVRNPVPVRSVQGIGDIFQKRLAEKEIDTIGGLLKHSPEEVATLLHCPKKRAEAILEAARKAFYDKTGVEADPAADIKLKGLSPDLLFYNDVPCPTNGGEHGDTYPFGKKPRIHDAFYIASEEAFSKRGYRVELNFAIIPGRSSDTSTNTPQLSWEFWDGEGWNRLDVLSTENWAKNETCSGTQGIPSDELRTVTIPSMPAVKKTKVSGKETYWIRVRLVGGDYGREYTIVGNQVGPGYYCPPVITGLKINYSKEGGDGPHHICTRNNGTFEVARDTFAPFKALDDVFPALYWAFDKPMKGGPFCLFLSVDESFEYPSDVYPRTRWQILEKDGSWIDLDALDDTRGFTRSGVIQFVISHTMGAAKRFGSETDLYWMRSVIIENFPETYQSGPAAPSGLVVHGAVESDPFVKPMGRKTITISNISLRGQSSKGGFPPLLGCFMNTARAFQARTVKDEVLGSSTGEPNQRFLLMSTPVVKSEVWVNEVTSLVEAEIKWLSEDTSVFAERRDEQGNLLEFWVRWVEKDDFVDSAPGDRHYTIDTSTGDIFFGDGSHGAIPPIGTNNIKATYATGGGKRGNVPAQAVSKLQSALPFVDGVYNPVAAHGGADREETDQIVKRAPSLLKHRHRSTALEDYEELAKEASRQVARVKVLPNMNATGVYETGWVTVVIVPGDSNTKPMPSPELRHCVETYLRERSPNVASIRVIPPSYVKVQVSAHLFTKVIDQLPILERVAQKKIEAFLHPLTGGPEGEGWPFGVTPCVSDIHAILEGIENVDHLTNVFLSLEGEDGKVITVTDTLDGVEFPVYGLPYSGDHTISARWEERKEN